MRDRAPHRELAVRSDQGHWILPGGSKIFARGPKNGLVKNALVLALGRLEESRQRPVRQDLEHAHVHVAQAAHPGTLFRVEPLVEFVTVSFHLHLLCPSAPPLSPRLPRCHPISCKIGGRRRRRHRPRQTRGPFSSRTWRRGPRRR